MVPAAAYYAKKPLTGCSKLVNLGSACEAPTTTSIADLSASRAATELPVCSLVPDCSTPQMQMRAAHIYCACGVVEINQPLCTGTRSVDMRLALTKWQLAAGTLRRRCCAPYVILSHKVLSTAVNSMGTSARTSVMRIPV